MRRHSSNQTGSDCHYKPQVAQCGSGHRGQQLVKQTCLHRPSMHGFLPGAHESGMCNWAVPVARTATGCYGAGGEGSCCECLAQKTQSLSLQLPEF